MDKKCNELCSLFHDEIKVKDFQYVVTDFRLNNDFDNLKQLDSFEKNKVEFLCNECCYIGCKDRKACYEAVSRKNQEKRFIWIICWICFKIQKRYFYEDKTGST